jgi:hypothetical protein
VVIADRGPAGIAAETVADALAAIAVVTVAIGETAAAVLMARPKSTWINS